jgi:hypothetical protein
MVGVWWFVTLLVSLLCVVSGVNLLDEANRSTTISFGIVTLVITAVAGVLLLWRVRLIRQVFARGVVVKGWVAHVATEPLDEYHLPQDRVVYRYGGREYRLSAPSKRLLARNSFAEGEAVEVMVDPDKPARAFLVDHFFGKDA